MVVFAGSSRRIPMKAVREKLEGELHALERELTVDLPREIKIAVAMGDLRENAEYHAALDRQRFVRARIGQLQRRLSGRGPMNPGRNPNSSLGFGSAIALIHIALEAVNCYTMRVPA